jgi:hypothetical protein
MLIKGRLSIEYKVIQPLQNNKEEIFQLSKMECNSNVFGDTAACTRRAYSDDQMVTGIKQREEPSEGAASGQPAGI